VGSVDLTMDDHIERELLLIKANVPAEQTDFVLGAVDDFGARVLDDKLETFTLELTGISEYLDEFVKRMDSCSELIAVVRSGAMAVARGASLLGAQRA
jgi:acetolactate synthase-1/3 small subunit